MRFAITGSTGMIGSTLTRELRRAGHDVTRVVRSYSGLAHGEQAVVWHPAQGVIEAAGLEGTDVVIHLAAESLAGVWTGGKKRRIRDSRRDGTLLIARTIATLRQRPQALFSASAIGFYGNRPGELALDENSRPGTGFLARTVVEWEEATRPAEDAGIRTVHMRMGNVLSPGGGFLGTLLPFYRLGLGARFGTGTQYVPWIALAEIATALLHVLDHPTLAGPFNFVAPDPVTNAELTEAIAAVVGRPASLKVPGPLLKLAPGGMSQELLLSDARVIPRRLLDSGYEFREPALRPALRRMLQRERPK